MGAGCDPNAEPEGCWAGLPPKPPKVEPPKKEKKDNSIFNFFTFTKILRNHTKFNDKSCQNRRK